MKTPAKHQVAGVSASLGASGGGNWDVSSVKSLLSKAGEATLRDEKNRATLLLCTVGMGLFLAWTAGDVHSKNIAGINGATAAHAADIAVGVGCNILTLLAVVLLSRRIAPLTERRGLCAAAGAAAVAGPLLVTASQALLGNLPLMALGSAMRGFAAAVLFLAFSELTARFPLRQASICYAGAYALSVILQLAMNAVGEAAGMALALTCGALSCVTLFSAAKCTPSSSRDGMAETRRWTFPWRPLLLTATYTLVTFTFLHALGSGDGGLGRLGGGIVAVACLVGCAFFFEQRFDATSLGVAALPLAVASLLLWCWAGDKAALVVMGLADASNVAFRIFVLSMLCNISYRYDVPPLWLFGIVRIAMMAAEGCGLALSMGAAAASANIATIAQPLCYATVLALILICTSAQDIRRISETSWNIFGKEGHSVSSSSERLRTVMSEQELTLWQCANAARTYGLTHREEEILSYLAQDMTRTEIARKLVLSESTVSTHIKHLYAKLAVHSREEALAKLAG